MDKTACNVVSLPVLIHRNFISVQGHLSHELSPPFTFTLYMFINEQTLTQKGCPKGNYLPLKNVLCTKSIPLRPKNIKTLQYILFRSCKFLFTLSAIHLRRNTAQFQTNVSFIDIYLNYVILCYFCLENIKKKQMSRILAGNVLQLCDCDFHMTFCLIYIYISSFKIVLSLFVDKHTLRVFSTHTHTQNNQQDMFMIAARKITLKEALQNTI